MVSFWKIFSLLAFISVIAFIGITFVDAQSLVSAPERFSPSDWVKEEQIKVYSSHILLNIENANWSKFTDSNSMDPFLDENANAIEIMPESPEEIQVGDVISYDTIYGVIIHRVIEVGEDDKGYYYIVKGDNNTLQDPSKVRFEDVEGVLVAIIY